jgi:predicted transcriptional regulator
MGYAVLILGDEPVNVEQIKKELSKAGLGLSFRCAGTRENFREELKSPTDLIIIDYDSLQFDALFALSIAMREVPRARVIFVSDQLDERLATELLKLGVEDCLSKTRLDRLPAVALRALERIEKTVCFVDGKGEKKEESGERIGRALRGPKKKPRDLVDIYADILRAANGGISKTRLVSRANLNFPRLKKYLDILVEEGLLEVKDGPSPTYSTSEKGLKFLERYEELKSFTPQAGRDLSTLPTRPPRKSLSPA